MSGKKYVPQEVILVCDKGSKPSKLKSISYTETTLFGEHMCTKVDKELIVNFEPLGNCSCDNNRACTAPVTDWTNVTDGITLGGNELLLENSELPCTLGGTIKIYYSMTEAMAAIQEQKKGFWASLWEGTKDVANAYIDFEKGLAKGLWKGLKGTVVGVYDLTVWAGKHTDIYRALNPQGYYEQLQKDEETFTAIGNAAQKAGTWMYRNSMVNAIANPNDYVAAQQENAVMMDKLYDKASNMSAEEWGDFTGQVLFEVILEVGTAGGAAALTAVKVADKGLDVVKAVNKLDNALDTTKALDKIVDGTKLPPVPDELGRVVIKSLDDDIATAMKKFDASTATNKQKGNFGEMAAHKNHMENPNLTRLGDPPPSGLNDKIEKGIDGIYENADPSPKFIIEESKYGTSRLGKTKDGKQMSDEWITGSNRLEDQVGIKKAKEIKKALKNNEVERILSKIDKTGKVTTQKLDKFGNVIKNTPKK